MRMRAFRKGMEVLEVMEVMEVRLI